MNYRSHTPDEKETGFKYSFAFKLKIVRQIQNGRISKHHAAKKYGVGRSSIDYWCKKFHILDENYNTMDGKNNSPEKEIKKLKERIEELEFIKDYQQDIIAEFENVTGRELAKKLLPKHLSEEIEKKKRKLR